jgi:hypothetical protein
MDIQKVLFRIQSLLIMLLLFSFISYGQKNNNSKLGKNSENFDKVKSREAKFVDIKDFFDPSSSTAGFQEAVN